MSQSAPPDPRVFHGYSDAPSHRILITVGWCLAGVFTLVGCFGLLAMAAPSDPCSPDGIGCGPEPSTFGIVAVALWCAALAAAGWSLFWHARDKRYRFQPPPNWPPVAPGWRPPRRWSPPHTFPKAPEGWSFWR
ncbi:hypothetical protein OHA18_36020 [Kribbella sp. NBC_00709]|uniref:hypothetical protein n=1 Tax=Kribbella sp. NBC_00709 TaxID=2975972 RepID=UPI002E2B3B96|nr:hypothetical protein [Kribbella sp. NBC_00709]